MKVLIIEDDERKLAQLTQFIKTTRPSINISQCRSYNSGLRAILHDSYSLVILDMTLPTFDVTPQDGGGRPLAYGGRELLQKISKRKLACHVVVVTQFDHFGEGDTTKSLEDLTKELTNDFEDNFIASIYYSTSSDDWKTQLASILNNDGYKND